MGVDVIEARAEGRPDAPRASGSPALLHGKPTLVLGPSGAGKSTLINLLVPDARAQIGEISQALNTGRHTTTTTQWYWLDARAQRRADRLAGLPGVRPAPHRCAGAGRA